MPEIEIARATEIDLAAASSVLVEAAAWLIECGRPLWDPQDLTPARIRPGLVDGSLHVARRRDDQVVGTIALSFDDPVFWPDAAPGESAFVHRLAVRRSAAGGRVAPAMLDWARALAEETGRRWLRLDCSAAHEGLVRYYEERGFTRCGEREVGGHRCALFQRALDGQAGPPMAPGTAG